MQIKALGIIDERLKSLQQIVHGNPDMNSVNEQLKRWKNLTFKMIGINISPEEGEKFQKLNLSQVPQSIKESIVRRENLYRASLEALAKEISEYPEYVINVSDTNIENEKFVKDAQPDFSKIKIDEWDIFICHADEDKDSIARPLAERLRENGFNVWYDEFSLKMGDGLRGAIDKGLSRSRFGVVILSNIFFKKAWPQKELGALETKENSGKTVILPVWHNITKDEIYSYSPLLANRRAAKSEDGLDKVVFEIQRSIIGEGVFISKQTAVEYFKIAYESKDYYDKMFYYKKAVDLDPKLNVAYYNLACLCARRHNEVPNNNLDREKALDYLKRAVKAGFFKLKVAQNDEDFISLSDDPEFKAVLKMIEDNLQKHGKKDKQDQG